MNTAILGTSFGDESKGRISHYLSTQYDYIIRTSGSENCGHTIYIDDKKYVYHYLPSLDFRDGGFRNTKAFLGAGMVINPENLLLEVQLFEQSFPGCAKKIIVDPYAFLIKPEHIAEDKAKNAHIGSTNKGVQPAYSDKISRTGQRLIDILSTSKAIQELKNLGVTFTSAYEMLKIFKKSKCLFEGAQGVLLDLNFGTYPYVTSSDCTVSSIGAAGFNSIKIDEVLGICKGGYSTRVGNGPFPTELFGPEADTLVKIGKEFGATTGRQRRVGAMDLVALKYACDIGGITSLVLTKLDVLNGFEKIKICTSYRGGFRGPNDFINAEPNYMTTPGWQDARNPCKNVRQFVKIVEEVTNRKVKFISAGLGNRDVFNVSDIDFGSIGVTL